MEVGRKLFHTIGGVLYVALYWVVQSMYGHDAALVALAIVVGIFLAGEFVRLKTRWRPALLKCAWTLRRKTEAHRIGVEVSFCVASLLCFAVFPVEIATVAILMLTFGDPIAALLHNLGPRMGKHGVGGIAAAVVVNTFIGVWLLPLATSVAMAVAAALTETFSKKIDDDFLVPIVACVVGVLV